MTVTDNDREIGGRDAVGGPIRDEQVAGKSKGILSSGAAGGIDKNAMLAGQLVHPAIRLVSGRTEPTCSGLGTHRSRSSGERGNDSPKAGDKAAAIRISFHPLLPSKWERKATKVYQGDGVRLSSHRVGLSTP
jgi:hypothetical protein